MMMRPRIILIGVALTLAVLATLGAAGWASGLFDRKRFHEQTFRDTEGLAVEDACLRWTNTGYRVNAVLQNRTDRDLNAAVLVGEVLDGKGQPVATNPMISVRLVPAGSAMPFEAIIPAKSVSSGAHVSFTVSVARWDASE